jgi:hypothetical protein
MRLMLAVLFLNPTLGSAGDDKVIRLPLPTDAQVRQQARQLDPKNDKAARLQAVKWFGARCYAKNIDLGLAALEECIRKDPDMECRRDAVHSRAMIARERKRPCPLAVIESFLDKEDEPRWMATACMVFFKSFEPGTVNVLLRAAESEKPGVRSDSLLILAQAGPKEKRALDAIEKGKSDATFLVRHTAHIAWLTATDRMPDYLTYVIRVREDAEGALTPIPKDPQDAQNEKAMRNLFILGSTFKLIEWSDQRPDELATHLLTLSEDKSPLMRRGAANLIGAVVIKTELPDPNKKGEMPWMMHILPYIEQGDLFKTLGEDKKDKKDKKDAKEPKKEPPQPSRAAVALQKQGVQARLVALRDMDPDRTVRDAARAAIARLATVKQMPK